MRDASIIRRCAHRRTRYFGGIADAGHMLTEWLASAWVPLGEATNILRTLEAGRDLVQVVGERRWAHYEPAGADA